MKPIPLEICIECSEVGVAADSIRSALAGGASRVELCAEMSQDGLTPDPKYCAVARELFGEQRGVLAMVRPHGRGFHYAASEIEQMCESIERAAVAGADGVVFGPLDGKGGIDIPALGKLAAKAREYGLAITFHRAFDALSDPIGSIPLLAGQGVARILTTGTLWGSGKGIVDGLEQVRRVIDVAGGRIEIVCAGGIRPGNVGELRRLLTGERVSVHAYSGVLRGGRVDSQLVRQLADRLAGSTTW